MLQMHNKVEKTFLISRQSDATKSGYYHINGIYVKQINPLNDNKLTEIFKYINHEVPKFLTGSKTALNEILHVFSNNDNAKVFFYICSKMFDRLTGKNLFKLEQIDGISYIQCIGDINTSDNIVEYININIT